MQPAADLSVWPPVGATAVDVTDAYERLAGRGYEYGPAFQGLQAMWRRGNEVFAEVAVPEVAGAQVGGFGIHPVLVDAALHAMGLAGERDRDDAAVLLAGGVSACRGGVAGAGPDSTGGCWRRCRWNWPMRRACRFCRCGSWWFVRSRRRSCRRVPAPRRWRGLLEVAWSPVPLGDNGIG